MIIDTSAVVAIVQGEPEGARFYELMAEAAQCRMSAGSSVELAAVAFRRFGPEFDTVSRALLAKLAVEIVSVSVEQAEIGRAAYRRYGRGSGHRACLNFGDCFAYALAKATGEPLLFKGDDFVHTDVAAAA